jgi:hypothetical protein
MRSAERQLDRHGMPFRRAVQEARADSMGAKREQAAEAGANTAQVQVALRGAPQSAKKRTTSSSSPGPFAHLG